MVWSPEYFRLLRGWFLVVWVGTGETHICWRLCVCCCPPSSVALLSTRLERTKRRPIPHPHSTRNPASDAANQQPSEFRMYFGVFLYTEADIFGNWFHDNVLGKFTRTRKCLWVTDVSCVFVHAYCATLAVFPCMRLLSSPTYRRGCRINKTEHKTYSLKVESHTNKWSQRNTRRLLWANIWLTVTQWNLPQRYCSRNISFWNFIILRHTPWCGGGDAALL